MHAPDRGTARRAALGCPRMIHDPPGLGPSSPPAITAAPLVPLPLRPRGQACRCAAVPLCRRAVVFRDPQAQAHYKLFQRAPSPDPLPPLPLAPQPSAPTPPCIGGIQQQQKRGLPGLAGLAGLAAHRPSQDQDRRIRYDAKLREPRPQAPHMLRTQRTAHGAH